MSLHLCRHAVIKYGIPPNVKSAKATNDVSARSKLQRIEDLQHMYRRAVTVEKGETRTSSHRSPYRGFACDVTNYIMISLYSLVKLTVLFNQTKCDECYKFVSVH